jgi:glycosyltransferase involved in cell wall biosynthesis
MSLLFDVQRVLIRFWLVRVLLGAFFVGRGAVLLWYDRFRGVRDFCWVYRVSGISFLRSISYRVVRRFVFDKRGGPNPLVEAFLQSSACDQTIRRFLHGNASAATVFRDVMVLKVPREQERGVLLLKYTAKFDLFVALFDLDRIRSDYYIVLEPCWAGYCDPSILMFLSSRYDVIVQSPEPSDFEFIERLDGNLIPVSLGASDWVDPELFAAPQAGAPRDFDLVMVANWGRHKNHRKLFEALHTVMHRPLSVLLIGFEHGGRTAADVTRDFHRRHLDGIALEVRERLSASEVASHLRRSKVFLLLSEKEGSNKAVVEAFFSDVPAIVYRGLIGGARTKINPMTGMLSSFEELAESIDEMIERHGQFSPRRWAHAHSGSRNATAELSRVLRSIAEARGERWTVDIVEKVNNPNLSYKLAESLPTEGRAELALMPYLRSSANRVLMARVFGLASL